jgi:hypothetical protein
MFARRLANRVRRDLDHVGQPSDDLTEGPNFLFGVAADHEHTRSIYSAISSMSLALKRRLRVRPSRVACQGETGRLAHQSPVQDRNLSRLHKTIDEQGAQEGGHQKNGLMKLRAHAIAR